MRAILFSTALVLFGFLSGVVAAEPNEIATAKLPKRITGILDVKYPAADLVKAFKDTDEDETIYTVVLKYKKREYEVTITGQGEILETAKNLSPKELPDVVAKAVHEKYPGSIVKEAVELRSVGDKITRTIHVEIETAQRTTADVILDLKGKILDEEVKQNKK
jgi:hypothetical protein